MRGEGEVHELAALGWWRGGEELEGLGGCWEIRVGKKEGAGG